MTSRSAVEELTEEFETTKYGTYSIAAKIVRFSSLSEPSLVICKKNNKRYQSSLSIPLSKVQEVFGPDGVVKKAYAARPK